MVVADVGLTLNSVSTSASRSMHMPAPDAPGFGELARSQRIQIWRWVAARMPTREVLVVEQGVAAVDLELDDACTSPADAAVTIVPSSSKKLHTLPSSGVLPPHQSGLRSNLAPVAGSQLFDTHAPGAVRRRVERRTELVRHRRDHRLRVVHRHEVREVAVRATRLNTATAGSVASTEPGPMTPFRPALPAATRRSSVAATSADVKWCRPAT